MGSKRILTLSMIMVVVALIIGITAIWMLYEAAFNEEGARLTETAQSQARMMEAVARFNKIYSSDYPGGSQAATVSQIIDSHANFKGFGKTGEFTLARRDGDQIAFLLSHRHHDLDKPQPVPFEGNQAEPMRRALSGKSGTVIGLDYRGMVVLAAYEPVKILDLGIVAKIDLAEVRAPFIKAAYTTAGIAFMVIAAGMVLFFYLSEPLIRKLKQEHDQLLSAIEKSSEGFILFDANDEFVYANQKYKDLYPSEVPDLVPGKTFRDIVKRCAYEGIVTSAIGREENWIDERVAKHQSLTHVSEQTISSGRWVRISEFRTDDGGIFGVRTDITDLKEKMRELDFQKYALDEHAIVSIADTEGNIIYANDKFCDINGYSREELLGQNHRILKSDEHTEVFYADMWRTISNGKVWHGEVKNRIKEGGYYWVYASIVPFLNERGEPFQFVCIRTDITERKKAEDDLTQIKEELERYVIELDASRNKMEQHAAAMVELAENEAALNNQLKYEVDVKNRFFSIISHDLKSPFTSLLGMTQMMSQMADSFSKDKLVEYASNVNDAGNRIFELLQNLLEWSRLQMEGAKIDQEKISLEDLTRESIEILNDIAREKEISLTNKIKRATAFADQDMVRTVIRNLIANALKFTPAGGTIEVSSIKQDDAVQVTVSDTGVGMSQKQAEKIFSLDQKTSTTGTAGEKGTGLGLPLCKDMLERNQGRIWVESTPGNGSQFHFTLPIEPEHK